MKLDDNEILCPYCGQKMIIGKLSLRSPYDARLVFSPKEYEYGKIETLAGGTVFDKKLHSGEIEMMRRGRKPFAISRAVRCPECRLILMKHD